MSEAGQVIFKNEKVTSYSAGRANFLNIMDFMSASDNRFSAKIYNVEVQTKGDVNGTYHYMGGATQDWGMLIDTDYDSYSIRYSC